ncbi:MAG: FliM/FliN family flagellar motor switch protein [Planctomycetota bacterium]|jgi:flagellar motor switch protein FliM
MSVAANNLSKEKIQQLLSAIGSGPQEDTSGIETTEYNWNQPRYFDRTQLNKLDSFTKRVAKLMNVKFTDYFHGYFDVNVISVKQYFAAELVSQAIESGQNDYYLAFAGEQEDPCGLFSVPAQTASTWAMQLLGDAESEAEVSDRDLTQLEESLVWDLLSALIKPFTRERMDFQPVKNIVRRLFPLELKGSEELCKITFDIKKTNQGGDTDQEKGTDQEKSDEVYILIQCSKLIPVVGQSEQIDRGFSNEDVSKAILARMQQMPVFITAQMASFMLTLKEIMSLEVGDILLLDKKINDSIELVTSGRTALLGRPAKLAGKYAVVITELCNDTG